MNQDQQECYCSEPSAKVSKYLFFKKRTSTLATAIFDSEFSALPEQLKKADHWNKRTLYGSPFPCLGTYLCSIFQSSVLSHYDLALCGND